MPTADQGQLEAPDDGIEVEIGDVELFFELGLVEVRPGPLVSRHVCGGGVKDATRESLGKLEAQSEARSEAQSESRPGRVGKRVDDVKRLGTYPSRRPEASC